MQCLRLRSEICSTSPAYYSASVSCEGSQHTSVDVGGNRGDLEKWKMCNIVMVSVIGRNSYIARRCALELLHWSLKSRACRKKFFVLYKDTEMRVAVCC